MLKYGKYINSMYVELRDVILEQNVNCSKRFLT